MIDVMGSADAYEMQQDDKKMSEEEGGGMSGDDEDEDENDGALGNWKEHKGQQGLGGVLKAFYCVQATFNEKFRKMWA